MGEISNHDDVIDSRNVIERLAELASRYMDSRNHDGPELDDNETAEVYALTRLAEEASSSADWQHGETLIRDSYFTDYAQELAEDVCEMPADLKWPYTCIDWEQAARELQMDYTSVDFDGVTYWIRS